MDLDIEISLIHFFLVDGLLIGEKNDMSQHYFGLFMKYTIDHKFLHLISTPLIHLYLSYKIHRSKRTKMKNY